VTQPDWDPVRRHYQNLIAKYGNEDARALNWSGTETQYLRFIILSQIGDLSGAKILDVGCGFGDFYPFLEERFGNIDYTGIDINPESIQTCQSKYPEACFLIGDGLIEPGEDYDYIIASGTFGYAIPDYKIHYINALKAWMPRARKGIACNFLNARQHIPDPLYATFDPLEVHAAALEITPRLLLRQDYLEHDLSLYLYREESIFPK
jgi:SAM-dependent methyltransferase